MDFRKVLTDSGVSLFRQIVSLSRGILVVPIITKLIGVDTYGVWTLVFSVVTIYAGVGGLHLHGALIRYGPSEETEGQTVSDLLGMAVITAGLVGLLVPVTIDLLGIVQLSGTAFGLSIPVIAAMLVVGQIFGQIVKNIPRAQGQVKRYELITLATQTFQTAALVATLTITRNIAAGLLSIVVAMVVVYTVVAVIYLPQRLRLPEVGNVRRYLSYCSPMVFKEFSHKMLSESDRFIVLFLLGPTAVGIYSVAYGVAALFPNLTNMFNSTLYPTITSAWDEGDTADIRRFYYNFLIGYVLLTIPVLFGLTLLARPVLRVLATETVAVEGWLLVPVVTVAFIFRGFETVLTYVLNAAEETGKVAKGTMIAFLTNLGLNLALIPVVGLMGAAIAMAVSMAVRLGYIYYYVRQHIEIPIPTRRIVKSAFSSIVMAVVLVYLVTTPDSAVIRLIVYPLVGAAVYFAVVYSVGGLTRGDIRQLRALL